MPPILMLLLIDAIGERMQSEQDHMRTAASAHVAILQAKLMQAQERGTTDALIAVRRRPCVPARLAKHGALPKG